MMDAVKSGSSSSQQKPVQTPGTVKLFVGGLTGEMTRETLAQYFSKYAEIVDSFVVYESQKPSGFGFITVKDKRAADQILQSLHTLNNSILDVKPALDRAQAKDKEESDRRRKIFVGGLPKNFLDESLKEFFEQFGTVQKCYVVKDTMTGKTRGFGFVIFSTDEGYAKALENPNLTIGGNDAHVKAATSKQDHRSPKTSERVVSPASKKSKASRRNQLGEKTTETNHNKPREQSPVNYNHFQFHHANPVLTEEYRPRSPSHYNGSYYADLVQQAHYPPYMHYQPTIVPQYHSTLFSSPYQYPVQPVHPPSFYSPKPIHSVGHPVQSGLRLQVYPISNRQIYYEPITHKSMVVKPNPAKLHSTQAVAYRPQPNNGGSMVNPAQSLNVGQPAKSAHFIGLHARHFGKSETGYPKYAKAPPQKYIQNPFGTQDDEEEEIREELKRAGDF